MGAASIFLLTGPMAAGKSTIGRLLAERFERGVHLEGDFFRRSIVSGRAEITPELEPAAVDQLRLRYRIAADVAARYAAGGFTVVLEDVVAGQLLSEVVDSIGYRPLYVVALVPAPRVLAARDRGRPAGAYGPWSAEELHRGFVEGTPRIGLWLDTSHQTPDETVGAILSRVDEAIV